MKNREDQYVFEFILTDEQKEALYELCDQILDADPDTAALCYYEVFGVEPTNKDLYGFHALLKHIHSEKAGNESEFKFLKVIQGGRKD